MTAAHTGIAGLEGRTSVGAALTIGVKGDRGYPTQRDRFHIVWPQEDDTGKRPYHPRFGAFNTAKPEHRRAIFGTIVNARMDECFEHSLRAHAPKGEKTPESRRPFCTGNGVRATRYVGVRDGVEAFEDIACPHDACPFRQTEPAGCKPHMRFLFMLQWQEGAPLPSMLCKFTSGSWNTVSAFVGFFREIESMAAAFGLAPEQINLAGLRFVMQLTERKSRRRKSRFPVVTIIPIDDIAEFLERQTRRALEISGRRPLALTDDSQLSPAVQAADWRAHEVTPDQGEE